jgi:hypothetical protein
MNILEVKEEIGGDLSIVLGDGYDEQRVKALLEQLEESLDIEGFIKQLIPGSGM